MSQQLKNLPAYLQSFFSRWRKLQSRQEVRAMFGQKEENKNPFSGLMPQKKSSASNLVQSAKVRPPQSVALLNWR
jgi:hypothetical protein